ncbi:MAG TPA: hypothetical protein VFT98_03600 [Myxococcota bacterium]|nr:hypothetical protein [Myxococcota bacterium]
MRTNVDRDRRDGSGADDQVSRAVRGGLQSALDQIVVMAEAPTLASTLRALAREVRRASDLDAKLHGLEAAALGELVQRRLHLAHTVAQARARFADARDGLVKAIEAIDEWQGVPQVELSAAGAGGDGFLLDAGESVPALFAALRALNRETELVLEGHGADRTGTDRPAEEGLSCAPGSAGPRPRGPSTTPTTEPGAEGTLRLRTTGGELVRGVCRCRRCGLLFVGTVRCSGNVVGAVCEAMP